MAMEAATAKMSIFILLLNFFASVIASAEFCRTNRAFVFVKPNAMIPNAIKNIKGKLNSFNINIVEEGKIDAEDINEYNYIDNHYGDIASKAMNFDPNKFEVSSKIATKFHDIFGNDIFQEIKKNNIVSAKLACQKLSISEKELGDRWEGLVMGKSLVKLGGGFYCGYIDGLYVINGFYMGMRSLFVTPPASILWMSVEWPETELSWKDFRSKVVGATDPTRASDSSIRRLLYNDWLKIGLTKQPSMKENGFHASASPFEAFIERLNWMGLKSSEKDPFGQDLIEAGISNELIEKYRQNPILHDGVALFDFLEDKSATECIEALQSLQ